jgi:hypothetical protein
MTPFPVVSEEELQLIRELLEREQAQISVEMRHTRTSSFKSALRERLNLIGAILSRIEGPPARPADIAELHH